MSDDPIDIMTGARLADTIRTVTGAMRGASALQLAALDRLLAHVRATEAELAAWRDATGSDSVESYDAWRTEHVDRTKEARAAGATVEMEACVEWIAEVGAMPVVAERLRRARSER